MSKVKASTVVHGNRRDRTGVAFGFASAALVLAIASGAVARQPPPAVAANVVLVTLDGARWQDVFGGLDLDILRSVSGATPVESTPTYQRFWAPTPEERRAKVMPFLWSTLAKSEGLLIGNRASGSRMQVANRHRFSYPGYNEILTGAPHDDVVTSNDDTRYGFTTVLEWLRRDLGLTKEQVAVFASWGTFNWIAESEEGAITINAGYEPFAHPDPEVRTLSDLQLLTPTGFGGARHDVYTFRFGMAHLKSAKPRVLYIAFDETDDWAHQRRYDLVFDALQRNDDQLKALWTWLQDDPQYRGRTTLILTVDHGRGRTAADWMDHGEKVDGAEEIWLGCFGPTVRARGDVTPAGVPEQRQVAATVAAALGRDFRKAVPGAGEPIAECLSTR